MSICLSICPIFRNRGTLKRQFNSTIAIEIMDSIDEFLNSSIKLEKSYRHSNILNLSTLIGSEKRIGLEKKNDSFVDPETRLARLHKTVFL